MCNHPQLEKRAIAHPQKSYAMQKGLQKIISAGRQDQGYQPRCP